MLNTSDITHISNEVPIFSACPPGDPLRSEARFCSSPAYLDLFSDIGVDVIELTGNHVLDWGEEAFIETLAWLDQAGYSYYGGGVDEETARLPIKLEHNGNRIAFIGCNAVGPENVWAGDGFAGAASCDLEKLKESIRTLAKEGYVIIVTFQHFEVCDYIPQSSQRADFLDVGAMDRVIVSGSQAHCPQTMTFVNGHFVHYGLGNLFFDQMDNLYVRSQFIDEHIIYDGKHISTILHTTFLEDYSQPRFMTPDERENFLDMIFNYFDVGM